MKRRVRRTIKVLIKEKWTLIWACSCPTCCLAGIGTLEPCSNPQCNRVIQVIERSVSLPLQNSAFIVEQHEQNRE